ncbi:MAG: bifunctional 3-(3-hydroxy-phenyl)propionate/3-hydroxycinnamic acid hydroxylase [Micropepsaceae bacterium]
MAAAQTGVLIAGMGPVGAALAALLARQGVSVIVCERETEVYRLPRAAHFDAEIMRLFQQLGVSEAMLPHSRPIGGYDFINAAGEMLMQFATSAETSQGWASGYLFHQPALEALLRDSLGAMSVEMLTGWSLTGFSDDGAGVTAKLSNGAETRTIMAAFLVGCDGGNSFVRKTLGIGLDDYGFDEPWLVVDTVMPDESHLKPHGVQLCDPGRPVTIMPMSPGRRRWEFMLLPHETPDEMMAPGRVEALMAPYMGKGAVEIVRRAVYRFHGLVAKEWRSGRVLLAGDSAHQMPPFAGQGMCSGLRDAANLAWKLALVLDGKAGLTLLDTYQAEREPHVRGFIELAIAMGKVVCMQDAEAAAQRDAGMIAQHRAGGAAPLPPPPPMASGVLYPSPRAGELSPQYARFDDARGNGAWLLHRGGAVAADDVEAVDVNGLAPWESWLGEAEAALIRPDRYVFGTGAANDLIAAWRRGLAG